MYGLFECLFVVVSGELFVDVLGYEGLWFVVRVVVECAGFPRSGLVVWLVCSEGFAIVLLFVTGGSLLLGIG